MANLLVFLFLFTFILFFFALIKPSIFTKIFKKTPSRKQIIILFGSILFILFILIGIFAPSADIKTDNQINNNNSLQQNIDTQDIKQIEDSFLEKEVVTNSEIKIEENNSTNDTFYEVTNVVDGDTIKVNVDGKIQTIRLIGINTPETVDPRKSVECFGIEASNKAKELLLSKKVKLEGDDTQDNIDKYSRLLRYVTTEEGLFYNLEIIKLGYAYEYTYNAPYKYQQQFKEAEKYAKDNKLGLWADGVCNVNNNFNEQTVLVPEPVQPSKSVDSSSETQDNYDCSYNKYNCSDFSTHAEAQAAFEYCGGVTNDIYDLDRDKDGLACETLP